MRTTKRCPHCGADVTWVEPAYLFQVHSSIRCGACQEYIYARGSEVIVAQPLARDPAAAAGLKIAPYAQFDAGSNREPEI